jgi:hypothetical protein
MLLNVNQMVRSAAERLIEPAATPGTGGLFGPLAPLGAAGR